MEEKSLTPQVSITVVTSGPSCDGEIRQRRPRLGVQSKLLFEGLHTCSCLRYIYFQKWGAKSLILGGYCQSIYTK